MNCILMTLISPVSPQEFTSISATCLVMQSNRVMNIFRGWLLWWTRSISVWTSTIRKKWWYLTIYTYQPLFLSSLIYMSKRGFFNINSNTHTSSFSYKVASQDTFLWINVTLCQKFALTENTKASGSCSSLEGHLKFLSLSLTAYSTCHILPLNLYQCIYL